MSSGSAGVSMSDEGLLSSLRYLFADFLDEQDPTPPPLPAGLPQDARAVVSDGIHLLMDYQGAGYARLYVERVQRFIGRQGIDATVLSDIARLMASRMAYEDAIRIAQLKLAEYRDSGGRIRSTEIKRFRLDELVDALPAVAADPLLMVLARLAWDHRRIAIPFSSVNRWGIRRLKMEAGLRRWRLFSIRYGQERVWVERWLHMIARALVKQPEAVRAIIETATRNAAGGTAATIRPQAVGWAWARLAARLSRTPPASTTAGHDSRLAGMPFCLSRWRSRAAITQVRSTQTATAEAISPVWPCWAAVSRM